MTHSWMIYREASNSGGEVKLSHTSGSETKLTLPKLDSKSPESPMMHVILTVEDDGTGLEPHEIERVFERAYTTKSQGSGYGLYLGRKFIEREGGRLTARPRVPRGMVFELELPMDESTPQ